MFPGGEKRPQRPRLHWASPVKKLRGVKGSRGLQKKGKKKRKISNLDKLVYCENMVDMSGGPDRSVTEESPQMGRTIRTSQMRGKLTLGTLSGEEKKKSEEKERRGIVSTL